MFHPPRLDVDTRGLTRSLRALPRALDVEVEACLRKGGRLVAAQARRTHTYVDRTGDLTRSILPVAPTGRFTDDTLYGGVGAIMYYASYVEDGTRHMRKIGGYQYLRLAQRACWAEVEALQERALEAAIRRVRL